MAGIGFRLNRLLRNESLLGSMGAFSLATIISSGAWIISILSLAVLTVVLQGQLVGFFAVVAHAVAASLILTGPYQLIVTRQTSDLIFSGKSDRVFPTFLAAMSGCLVVTAPLGALLFWSAGSGSIFRMLGISTFVILSWIWIASAFIGGALSPVRVVAAYAVGYSVAIVAAWKLGDIWGDEGALAGFLLGNMALLLLLIRIIIRTYGRPCTPDFSFLKKFSTYRNVALCGLFFNIGIWSDKCIVWWVSAYSEPVSGWLRAAPFYDFAVSFALITIIPGMATFLLTIETEFAARHHDFLMCVNHHGSLRKIKEAREAMHDALADSIRTMARVQACASVLSMIVVVGLSYETDLDSVRTATLLTMIVAMGALAMALTLLTVLFYLDRQAEALQCALLFAVVNTVATLLLIDATGLPNAYGFALAALSTVFLASYYANRAGNIFEQKIFASQPAGE